MPRNTHRLTITIDFVSASHAANYSNAFQQFLAVSNAEVLAHYDDCIDPIKDDEEDEDEEELGIDASGNLMQE